MTGLFEDDHVLDLESFYDELMEKKFSIQEAVECLQEEFLHDDDYDHLFWIGLAAIQWKRGHLQKSIAQKAIELIQSQADHELWEDNQERIDELEKWKSIFLSRWRKDEASNISEQG